MRSVGSCSEQRLPRAARSVLSKERAAMPTKKIIPDELVVAKLSIEAASIALGALFERI